MYYPSYRHSYRKWHPKCLAKTWTPDRLSKTYCTRRISGKTMFAYIKIFVEPNLVLRLHKREFPLCPVAFAEPQCDRINSVTIQCDLGKNVHLNAYRMEYPKCNYDLCLRPTIRKDTKRKTHTFVEPIPRNIRTSYISRVITRNQIRLFTYQTTITMRKKCELFVVVFFYC